MEVGTKNLNVSLQVIATLVGLYFESSVITFSF